MGDGSLDSQVWGRLWKLSIPGKIKICGWRAIQGLIQCQGILYNHIGDDPQCPMCSLGQEDLKHLMFTCIRSKAVWNALGVWDHIQNLFQVDRSREKMIEEAILRGWTGCCAQQYWPC